MDDQISNNADDIDDIKEDISDLEATDADLQTQINNKTVDSLNVSEWNNYIAPRTFQKQIGTYYQDGQPHFQILFYWEADDPRQSVVVFDIPVGMPGNRGKITSINGVFLSGGIAYPVGYTNLSNKSFQVYADESERKIYCTHTGMNWDENDPWKIRLTVTYTN